ncbi:hypothetical protein SAMD00019534_046060 [Acytostelium subglobosum LB1]|uniref:hypothetical protein n=1 Tax=Acytostelium subglobosum LB1 TaxID=1410327 RepID=UPI000645162B|nr:hypothetical protein SAMD00019534_046060 [Acytostelium subglobosum LB1]GAM21431.1 hypothetical protein SAMD00019534_046060 [Acytostelium subglobosum LB1]|eukprot:XP_012755550.1 hypothetical protein SAMD00019534_046060 [Acytostelium subglobosum LB1]
MLNSCLNTKVNFSKSYYFTRSSPTLNINNNNNNNNNNTNNEPLFNEQKRQTKPTTTAPNPAPEALIYELDSSNFADICLKSKPPVVLLCYTEWSTHCKQLITTLEQQARNNPGSLVIAKLNVETQQELAQNLRVQDVPTVFSLHGGKVLRQFSGAPTKEVLDQFIDDLLALDDTNVSRKLVTKADGLYNAGDVKAAAELYHNMLTEDGLELTGLKGLLKCGIKDNNKDMLTQLISIVKDKYPEESSSVLVKQAEKILELTKIVEECVASDAGGLAGQTVETLQEAVRGEPRNLGLKYLLAIKHLQAGQAEQAMQQLLDSIKIDKHHNNDEAKLLLFKLFESMPTDPLVLKYRQRFSNIWFL